MNLVPQVIESQQTVEKHQAAIGQRKIIFGVLADLFQLPHGVIGKIAHRSRGERRNAGNRGRPMLSQKPLDDLRNVSLQPFLRLTPAYQHIAALRLHHHIRTRTEERIAANLLAPLHRLQQESFRLMGGNRQKRGNRREQVCGDRLDHRHQRGFPRQAGKLFVLGTKHIGERQILRRRISRAQLISSDPAGFSL